MKAFVDLSKYLTFYSARVEVEVINVDWLDGSSDRLKGFQSFRSISTNPTTCSNVLCYDTLYELCWRKKNAD